MKFISTPCVIRVALEVYCGFTWFRTSMWDLQHRMILLCCFVLDFLIAVSTCVVEFHFTLTGSTLTSFLQFTSIYSHPHNRHGEESQTTRVISNSKNSIVG